MCIILHAKKSVCVPCACLVVRRPEVSVGSPKTGVADICELLCGCWELSPGPLEGQPSVMTVACCCEERFGFVPPPFGVFTLLDLSPCRAGRGRRRRNGWFPEAAAVVRIAELHWEAGPLFRGADHWLGAEGEGKSEPLLSSCRHFLTGVPSMFPWSGFLPSPGQSCVLRTARAE